MNSLEFIIVFSALLYFFSFAFFSFVDYSSFFVLEVKHNYSSFLSSLDLLVFEVEERGVFVEKGFFE